MSIIILFDGVCNLCNATVQLILKHDRKEVFRFASLQSESGAEILARYDKVEHHFQSLILVEEERIYEQSAAALKVVYHLGWPYRILYVFILIPRPLRDSIYRLIARNRYRLFGKKESCMLPAKEWKHRFL